MSEVRTSSRFKRLVLYVILGLLLAGFIALTEKVARFLYPRFAPASGRQAVAVLRSDAAPFRTGYFLEHPYLFYEHLPGYSALGSAQFDSRGYRGPEIAGQPPDVRILCLGGSTTESFPYAPLPGDSWPGQLERMLRQRTDRSVEVVNGGLKASTSAELLAHYIFRDRYLKPQIVVLHVGINDGMMLLFPHYDPEYTHAIHGWRGPALVPRPFERALLRSYLVRWIYAVWLRDLSLAVQIGADDFATYSPAECLANASSQEPEGFRRNLDLLLRTITSDGATPVLFAEPWAPKERFKQYEPYYDAMVTAFAKDVEVLHEEARRHGVMLVELPPGTLSADMFFDFCHLQSPGETIKATRLADALAPLVNARPVPVGSREERDRPPLPDSAIPPD